jgi:hypothetical protein
MTMMVTTTTMKGVSGQKVTTFKWYHAMPRTDEPKCQQELRERDASLLQCLHLTSPRPRRPQRHQQLRWRAITNTLVSRCGRTLLNMRSTSELGHARDTRSHSRASFMNVALSIFFDTDVEPKLQ